jgi:transcriptional regulator with XRE-family HTH domain
VTSRPNEITAGRVLYAWRKFSGLTQGELAAAVAELDPKAKVSAKNTVTGWERESRGLTPQKIRLIAQALGLDLDQKHAMVGMWWSAGSSAAIVPRTYWEHNYHDEGGPDWLWMREEREEKPAQEGPGDDGVSVRKLPEQDIEHQTAYQIVPPRSGGPVWVWMRHTGGAPVGVTAGWGPFGAFFEVPNTAAGALIVAVGSLSNPPVQVTFKKPAWADFGNGVIPQGVLDLLGIQALDSVEIIGRRFDDPPGLDEKEFNDLREGLGPIATTANRINIGLEKFAKQMGAMRPDKRPQPLEGARVVEAGWDGALKVDGQGELVSQLLQPPERIKDIRKVARNMSAISAARLVNAVSGQDGRITDNQIETLDKSGHLPDIRNIITRLDYVYGLDGYLGIERTVNAQAVLIRQGECQITFPDYWVGPIWLQLRAPAGNDQATVQGRLELHWGHWCRVQIVEHGTVVTTRKSSPSDPALHVLLPPGWRLAAGTGVVPGAIDVNHDWYPLTWRSAIQLAKDGYETLRAAGRIQFE